jgi:hypothetical protein
MEATDDFAVAHPKVILDKLAVSQQPHVGDLCTEILELTAAPAQQINGSYERTLERELEHTFTTYSLGAIVSGFLTLTSVVDRRRSLLGSRCSSSRSTI